MPDANPAPAPQSGLTHAFGICVDCICLRVRNDVSEVVEDIVSKLLGVDRLYAAVACLGDEVVDC